MALPPYFEDPPRRFAVRSVSLLWQFHLVTVFPQLVSTFDTRASWRPRLI